MFSKLGYAQDWQTTARLPQSYGEEGRSPSEY